MSQFQGSTFERRFDELVAGTTLHSVRHEAFDAHHGLFYAPLRYEVAQAPELFTAVPDEKWIADALAKFVRAEFGIPPSEASDYGDIPLAGDTVELVDIALSLRDRFEQHLVYGDLIATILADVRDFDIVRQMYSLLCTDAFGQTVNRKNIAYDLFESFLTNMKVGCRLVVPGLPFRDQNSLRTRDDPGHTTLSEALFLIRLHCTALAIYQVLPTGADVLVLSDGPLYAPIFGVNREDAIEYVNGVKRLRDDLNIRGTVSIIDLQQLLRLYDRGSGAFEACVEQIEKVILAIRKRDMPDTFVALERGMRWNFNTRSSGLNAQVIREWLQTGEAPSLGAVLPSPEGISLIAARYAATNLALRWHDVIQRMFPTVVRATMHAKPDQMALPRLGSCFPWNGVAVGRQGPQGLIDIEVHSLAEAARRGYPLVGHADRTGAVVYYERK